MNRLAGCTWLLLPALLFGLSTVAAADGVTSEVLVKSTKSWNGAPLPAWPAGQPEITIARIRVEPGVKLPMHDHPVIIAGVLLSGSLTVATEDGQTLKLGPGDPIVEVVNTWHYGANEGTEPTEIIVFYAGSEGMPLSRARE